MPSFYSVSNNLRAPIWMALRKRRVTFLICFRKRGVPKKGGFLIKGEGGSNPGGNYERIKTNFYWRMKFLKQATYIGCATAKLLQSVQISKLTSLESYLQRIL